MSVVMIAPCAPNATAMRAARCAAMLYSFWLVQLVRCTMQPMKLTSLPWRRHRSITMGLLVIAQLAPPQFDPAPATAPSSISAGPRNHGAESLPCPYTAVP